jgi:hypothetical protein
MRATRVVMRPRSSIDGDGLRCSRTDLMTSASTAVAGTRRTDPARWGAPWRTRRHHWGLQMGHRREKLMSIRFEQSDWRQIDHFECDGCRDRQWRGIRERAGLFSAWLGLVPKQISTGDRTILGRKWAGYRKARPTFSKSSFSPCNARPVHTAGGDIRANRHALTSGVLSASLLSPRLGSKHRVR